MNRARDYAIGIVGLLFIIAACVACWIGPIFTLAFVLEQIG